MTHKSRALYNRKAAGGSPTASENKQPNHNKSTIDFRAINFAALQRLPDILMCWLPDGKREGSEWVARNPRRVDHRVGSFKINLRTGLWADFATGDRGGDVVSLAAYLGQIKQKEAAFRLAKMLGLGGGV